MSSSHNTHREANPIKGFNGFKKVLEKGLKFRNSNLIAFVEFNDAENQVLLYGVSIGKKAAKKAVVRNRVKRLLRELIRGALKRNEIPQQVSTIILIRTRAPEKPGSIKLVDIDQEFSEILKKIKAYIR